MPEKIKTEQHPASQWWDGVARLMVSSVVKGPIHDQMPGQYTMGPVINLEPHVDHNIFLEPGSEEYRIAIGLDT